jgi:hypothetical protein
MYQASVSPTTSNPHRVRRNELRSFRKGPHRSGRIRARGTIPRGMPVTISSPAFANIPLYIVIGRSLDHCCVSVENHLPGPVVEPQNGGKYAVCRITAFNAPKKVSFVLLIMKLLRAGVFPRGDPLAIRYPHNPSHKYYVSLLLTDIPTILQVVDDLAEWVSSEPPRVSHTNAQVVEQLIAQMKPRSWNERAVIVVDSRKST